MPAPPSFPPNPVRRGVTLLELLVVLVLMGIAAAIVAPALTRPVMATVGGQPDDAAGLVADARRTAIRRGEPLRLRLAADGVWALVGARDGAPIGGGRISSSRRDLGQPLDIRIDAMGSCTPAGALNAELQRGDRAFDPLDCIARANRP